MLRPSREGVAQQLGLTCNDSSYVLLSFPDHGPQRLVTASDRHLAKIVLYSFAWRQIFSNPLLRISSTSVCPSTTVLDPLKLAIQNWKAFWDKIRASILPK